jgi:hypothetical protein
MSARRTTKILACAALAVAAQCALPADAQVRTEAAPASMVNPDNANDARSLFERSGLFMIAGGVLPSGHAVFLLDQGGNAQPVAAASIRPVALADGTTALREGGRLYHVAMPAGLACPLGQFVARDGIVAYTVPKYIDPDSRMAMLKAGLAHHRIAREFDGTPFEGLLRAADFGQTVPLPSGMAQQITASINTGNGIDGLVIYASEDLDTMIGSYINSGVQVTYHVYLMPASGSVEIGGVPLRYFWKLEHNGAAGVFSVEMYAQSWGANAHLTDFSAKNAQPTQYDVVNFYQVSALFRQLHENDAGGFARFVEQACNKAI